MATCADCVHVEACSRKQKIVIDGLNRAAQYAEKFTNEKIEIGCSKEESLCELFCDRSRFVELPFQLGDDVYCTRMFKIYKKTVKRIELDDDGLAIVTDDGYCIDSTICFRSQEAAEQALKERVENA